MRERLQVGRDTRSTRRILDPFLVLPSRGLLRDYEPSDGTF